MNKICVLIVLLFFSATITAQKTYYYKLTKKVHNGTPSTNVSGGQFITFLSDICYESDIKGIGVGHGKMNKSRKDSDDNIISYFGGCYYGSESVYRFTKDLSVLNVVTQNGDVYLYKRTTAPANATTCSLIRSRRNSSNNNQQAVVVEQPIRQQQPMQTWVECGFCHGSGQCHVCLGRGRGPMQNGSCLTCGFSGRCTHCAGQGGHYEMRY
jgi:hypothetical protein